MQDAFAYYRVSTIGQGESGLGLEAQRTVVEDFAEHEGYYIKEDFTEIASGRKNDRAVLLDAIRICKRNKATLLIAYVDRLTRSLWMMVTLIESKVKFKIVTQPHAPKIVLEIQAVMAEERIDDIREKTRNALQALKSRGKELGHFGHVLARYHRIKAKHFAKEMQPTIEKLQSEGFQGYKRLADELNRRGISTYRNDGSQWHKTTVNRLIKRIAILKALEKEKDKNQNQSK
jgi:DNA invertase Pin-like site-specific DNA recombinase